VNEKDIHQKIEQALNELDLLDEIQPSAAWSTSLMERLNRSQSGAGRTGAVAIVFVAVLLLVLMNVGSFITVLRTGSGKYLVRESDLQLISNELLSHPILFKE
jgi:hypothetical protein